MEEDPEKKKEVFLGTIKLSNLDNTTIMTGTVTPPTAMVVKRAGEFLPRLSIIKSTPDFVFVPSVTVTMAALEISKVSRRLYRQSMKAVPSKSVSLIDDKLKALGPEVTKELSLLKEENITMEEKREGSKYMFKRISETKRKRKTEHGFEGKASIIIIKLLI
ncbi:hypothetical protein V6N12_037091 [Hibiscus sabdariffa]|uniref:Uncharacterized protein n=1 Tax=Hibiscus sabdariffa TaxID=183260 RepID=A0ABR2ANP2_9ROSI